MNPAERRIQRQYETSVGQLLDVLHPIAVPSPKVRSMADLWSRDVAERVVVLLETVRGASQSAWARYIGAQPMEQWPEHPAYRAVGMVNAALHTTELFIGGAEMKLPGSEFACVLFYALQSLPLSLFEEAPDEET